jgi:uncharacterized membrane protein YbhN (UPF0104 family)
MAAFAEQQRHLLAAFGVKMPAAAALALTYTRSAISIAVPGGSAISAGYAFRAYRTRGASEQVGVAVMLLSGVASVGGLALLYGADTLAWVAPRPAMMAVLAISLALAALAVRRGRPVRSDLRAAAVRDIVAPTSRRARLWTGVRDTLALARCVSAQRWVGVLLFATLNWLTDLACLLAAVHAVGLTIPIRDVATAYLATQLIRQIPATPGGIGLIEASLLVALTTTGTPPAPAAGAILIYRLLSCWGLLPTGLLCWVAQRNAAAPACDPSPATTQIRSPRPAVQTVRSGAQTIRMAPETVPRVVEHPEGSPADPKSNSDSTVRTTRSARTSSPPRFLMKLLCGWTTVS